MEKKEMLAIFLMAAVTIGLLALIFGVETVRRSTHYTVELNAMAPEKGNWDPKVVTVPYGEDVRIYLRNTDTVSHGFALPDFEVVVDEIKAGHVEIVEFTADKRGTFPFLCTIWCSARHIEMTGALVVE